MIKWGSDESLSNSWGYIWPYLAIVFGALTAITAGVLLGN